MKSATSRKTARGRSSRSFGDLTAKDIMAKRIITVSPTAPLSEVERLLTENRISGMPVTDSSGRAIGVVSYRDLLDHYAENPDARPRREPGFFRLPTEHLLDEDFESFSVPPESEDTVEDVMTPAIIDVATDAPVQEICRTMTKHSVHRVLVTDTGTGRMVGLVSSMSVLAAIAGE
jgi:CBS domain-containing protein